MCFRASSSSPIPLSSTATVIPCGWLVPGAHHDLPRPIACLRNSLEGIEDEVQDDLLELDAISAHAG